VTNRRTGERATHIPAGAFLDENEALYDEDAELEAGFFEGVISDYTDGRNVVLVIEAGESHMWGDAGTPRTTGEHLAQLFKTYGAGNFSPFDPASHFIGNWFNGVKVYSAPTNSPPSSGPRSRKPPSDSGHGTCGPASISGNCARAT
jgi:hypothetical protein